MQRDLKELGVKDFIKSIPKGTPIRHRASFKRLMKALNGVDREGGGTVLLRLHLSSTIFAQTCPLVNVNKKLLKMAIYS